MIHWILPIHYQMFLNFIKKQYYLLRSWTKQLYKRRYRVININLIIDVELWIKMSLHSEHTKSNKLTMDLSIIELQLYKSNTYLYITCDWFRFFFKYNLMIIKHGIWRWNQWKDTRTKPKINKCSILL